MSERGRERESAKVERGAQYHTRHALCIYRSVPDKRPWALKHNSQYWPAWAIKIPSVCIEDATVAPWNAVHWCLPRSGRLPGTLLYM